MIRDFISKDRELFLTMVKIFYSSSAVAHNVDTQNFEITFQEAMNNSPFVRALMFLDGDTPAGYALLSFTYSNEVGGMVVLVEEVYVSEEHRGRGIAGEFFQFLETEYPDARRFRLEVTKSNTRAIELYRRLGYEPFEYMQMVKDI